MAYCFVDLPDFDQVLCNNYKSGGNSAVAFLETDHSITDFTQNSEWATAIAAGEATIVKDIKGDFPVATPSTQESPIGCGPENITTGMDFTFTYIDANVSPDNDASYAAINNRYVYVVWYECEQDQIRVVQREAKVTATPATSPASNKEFQTYSVTIEWTSPPDWYPVRYSAPTAIFT